MSPLFFGSDVIPKSFVQGYQLVQQQVDGPGSLPGP
jgi:hypothetical protein